MAVNGPLTPIDRSALRYVAEAADGSARADGRETHR